MPLLWENEIGCGSWSHFWRKIYERLEDDRFYTYLYSKTTETNDIITNDGVLQSMKLNTYVYMADKNGSLKILTLVLSAKLTLCLDKLEMSTKETKKAIVKQAESISTEIYGRFGHSLKA